MTSTTLPDARWLHAIAAAAFLAASLPQAALNAQGLESPETVDRIVGSQISEEQAKTTAEIGKVSSAIDRTRDNIGTVRKTSKLDKVDIVFLTDAARSEGGPPPVIENKVRQHQDDVAELRKEIEANALLFNAIDSRRVAAQDVLAVAFDDPGKIIIYAAAKPSD
ncbi:hypothetical protein BFX40_06010 [Mesorhizobium sp. SEMIA 3007]|jgi:hypothetical protein|uniref:Uncharacterized protein n=1 Tax=Mesorhizobium jarvisii TaxID=1777867 RepID=A0A6M7TCN0_9HYPH|nr:MULTISPECIES: hypothetical protein [Mesorhizobium]AID33791.1 hypothetical protein MCHK_6000 [Mesorhizobium huakuii 7653R]MCH4556113.1 hypothetical protein [Mesorhizobium jarvisii]OBQ60397.1 hypothetical protein A9K72_23375 [Mesorhizobium loti]ODA92500.1 hypothetical protein BFX40_06010 [Mesorhizobium sp. SEMIA 3007]QKC61347.1 hypothetical protein EB229_02740 [Mesorhizobium jarvisii]